MARATLLAALLAAFTRSAAGCDDTNAENFYVGSNLPRSSCIYPPTAICSDPTAINYASGTFLAPIHHVGLEPAPCI